MSYQLLVYAPTAKKPSRQAITALLDVAGWQWAPVASLETLRKIDKLGDCFAIGWDLADDIGDSVITAVDAGNPDLLSSPIEHLSVVEIVLESPFTPDPELISELRESEIDPDLVTRAEEAAACWVFRADGRVTEPTVEFLWALASAAGVLTDGVLEDEEDGALLDCTDDGDE